MKKLKLDLDDLQVESFHTTPGSARLDGGTVQGYTGEQCIPTVEGPTCSTCQGWTCDPSCNGTCGGASCDPTSCSTCGGATCDSTCNCATCPGDVCDTSFGCYLCTQFGC